MKTAIKVLIWIGMICQCFLIYPIVVGILALKKLDEIPSSKELQTMGILTTIFCSLIGGILMLCIKDDDLGVISRNSNENIIIKKKVIVKKRINESVTLEQRSTQTVIKIFMYITLALLFISYIFSISALLDYSGIRYIPFIINCVQIVLITVTFIIFLCKKQLLSKATNILTIINGILSLAQIPLSIISNYRWAYWISWSGDEIYYGEAWEYWVIFGINVIIFIMTTIAFIRSLKTNQSNITWVTSKEKEIITTSNIEEELNELQRLLDNGAIKQEEYNSIRASIISKYYSN